MDSKELVKLIDNQVSVSISSDIAIKMRKSGLVAAFVPPRYNFVETEGAIVSFLHIDSGGTPYFTRQGFLSSKGIKDFQEEDYKNYIIPVRHNSGEYEFVLFTDIPCETFTVMDGEYKYCRGVVFSINDLN